MGARDDDRRARILAARAKAAPIPAPAPEPAPAPVKAPPPVKREPARVATTPAPAAPPIPLTLPKGPISLAIQKPATYGKALGPRVVDRPATTSGVVFGPERPSTLAEDVAMRAPEIEKAIEAQTGPALPPMPPDEGPRRPSDLRTLTAPTAVMAEHLVGDVPLSVAAVSPERQVREAARDADTRKRAQDVLKSRGLKATLGLDESASVKDVARSLSATTPDKVRLDHQRYLESRYNEIMPAGQRLGDLDPEKRAVVQKEIARRAALDIGTLQTVGLFTNGRMGIAERDPNSTIDALKPTAEVVGLDKLGQPIPRYESPGEYIGDVMTAPAYLAVSTGVPQAVFQTTFGHSPDATQYEKGRVFDPKSVRERRTFLSDAFETNPYDKHGVVNQALHTVFRPLARAQGKSEANLDELAADVTTVLAPIAGAAGDVVFPDPIMGAAVGAHGLAQAGKAIKGLDKIALATKLEKQVAIADRVSTVAKEASETLGAAAKEGADDARVVELLKGGRDRYTEAIRPMEQQAKDAVEDAARVRTRAERAGVTPERTIPYGDSKLTGTLDDAEKVEQIIVGTPGSAGAAMNVPEALNRTVKALERGAITAKEAAAFGERLLDTAHVTSRALVDGVKSETQAAKAAAASLLSALEIGGAEGRGALDRVMGKAEAAKKALTGNPEKASQAAKKLTEKAFEALHEAIGNGGVKLSARELGDFHAALVDQLAPRLVDKTPEGAKMRAYKMVNDALLATGKGDGKIHPETMAALDALFRDNSAEAAAATRTIAPLRQTGAATSLLLGEGGPRVRAMMGQGAPTAAQVVKAYGKQAMRAIGSLFVGGNELAPFTKEGLTKAAQDWAHDSARMMEAVGADMESIDTIEDAGRYLDGGQTRTNGYVTSGKNRTDIFLHHVQLTPGDGGNVLDFVKAMMAPPIGRPEYLTDRGWFRMQMAVIDAVEGSRAAKATGEETVEAIAVALHRFATPHANTDGWTRRITAWIATQAEDVALLDRGFGDGIILTEHEHENLKALAGGAFTLAGDETPATAVERGLAVRKFTGAGASYTPVRIGSGAGAMEAMGAETVREVQAVTKAQVEAANNGDPIAKLKAEYINARMNADLSHREYVDRLQGWVAQAERFEEAGDEDAIAAVWKSKPIDRRPWYAEYLGELEGKIKAAGEEIPSPDMSVRDVLRIHKEAGFPGVVLHSRAPLSPEAMEGARYARAKVAELDPEGKNPVGAWRRVMDEMTSRRLDKMTERDKGIRAAANGQDYVSVPRRKTPKAAVPEYVEPFPELKADVDQARRAWSDAMKRVTAEGGDPWSPSAEVKYPEFGQAAREMEEARARLRAAQARDGRVLYSREGDVVKGSIQPIVAQTETPAFRKWFGGSKVVDAEGKPLRVYHGTGADFATFRTSEGRFGKGVYLTADPQVASDYAYTAGLEGAEHPGVMPLYARMENPLYVRAPGEAGEAASYGETLADVRARHPGVATRDLHVAARQEGRDGIVLVRGDGKGGTVPAEIIAFDPEQIKSATANVGTFDPENPSILHSRALDQHGPATASRIAEIVPPGGTNARDALAGVAKAASEEGDAATARVAAHLAEQRGDSLAAVKVALIDAEDDVLGLYRADTGEIGIAKTAPPRTVVHEAIHAVTTQALRDPSKLSAEGQQAVKNLHGLFDAVKESAEAGHYGLTNVDEFVAEAFSNPKFQEVLRNTPISVVDGKYVVGKGGVAGKLRTMWDAFVANLADILGFTDTDALGHVIANANVVIKEGKTGEAAAGDVLRAKKAAPPTPLDKAKSLYTQTMDSTVYVPTKVREAMVAGISRAYTPSTGISRSLLSWWKLSVTRGALVAKPGYLLNNVPGDFEQVLLAFGLQDAIKTTVRTEGASIVAILGLGTPTAVARTVLEPTTGPLGAAAIDHAWGLFVSSFIGKNKDVVSQALHASADVGEKGAQAVSRLLGKSSFRIEVGKILEGGSETIRVGDHYYSSRELKEAAVRFGVWDSFDKAELAPEMRNLGRFVQLPATGAQHLAETISLRRRLGLYVTLLEGGLDPERAARGVTKALFDYRATLTDFERTYVSTFLLPFWSWQKNMNRLVIGSMMSPIGAYRVKMAMSLGRAAEEAGEHRDWFTGRPAADGDDVGLLTSYMTGPKAQADYAAWRRFRAAVEAKEGKIAPKDWNALIWNSNPEIPASTEWATRADVEPKMTKDQIVGLRAYLARWWTPEMSRSYLRDRAGVRMTHLSTGPTLGPGENDSFWNLYAPHSGVDGATEWCGRAMAALYSVATLNGPGATENASAMVDVERAPVISDLIALTKPASTSQRKVAQGIVGPMYRGSERASVGAAEMKDKAIALAPPLGSFLTRTSTVDAIADHPLVNAVSSHDGVYVVNPWFSWIADTPFIADMNKRMLSEETVTGKGHYTPDTLRLILNSYGFQTPMATTEDALREQGERYAESKASLSSASVMPTEDASTSAE